MMILLFTSAKEERFLHKRDLLNVCCEATGTYIQFGYGNIWIPENLRTGDRIKNKQALIIYCEPNLKGGIAFTYHPVRLAKIGKPVPEYDSLTIPLQLDHFFDYEAYKGQISNIIQEFQKYVLASQEQPTPTNPRDPKTPARFVREENEWEKASFSKDWVPFIEHMRSLEGLKSYIFLSVQPSTFGGPPSLLFPKYSNMLGRTVYEVDSGKSYEISLYMLLGHSAMYRTPELVVSETVASTIGPFSKQRSSGYEADFIVNFKRSFQEELCKLLLRIPPKVPGAVQSPEIEALIRVKAPRLILYSAVFSLTLGAVLVSIGPDLVKEFASIISMGMDSWLYKNALLISFIIKAFGAAALVIGSYLGFRKLPFKTS